MFSLALVAAAPLTSAWAEEEEAEATEAEEKIHWSKGFYEFDERSWVNKDEMAFANRVHYDSFYHDDGVEEFLDSYDLFGLWKSITIEKDPNLVEGEPEVKKGKAFSRREKDSEPDAAVETEKVPLLERMFEGQRKQVSKEVSSEPKPKAAKPKEEEASSSSEPLFHRLFKRNAEDDAEKAGEES